MGSLRVTNLLGKTNKLTLKNTTIEDNSNVHDIVSNPSDPFCTVRLVKHYLTHFCPPHLDYFFCHKAYGNKIKEWKKVHGPNVTWEIDPDHPMGKNYINSLLKDLATKCKFDFASKCTGHSKRRQGISKMANVGANQKEIKQASRHKSVVVEKYQELDKGQKAIRYKAFHYNDPSLDDSCPSASSEESNKRMKTTDTIIPPQPVIQPQPIIQPQPVVQPQPIIQPQPVIVYPQQQPLIYQYPHPQQQPYQYPQQQPIIYQYQQQPYQYPQQQPIIYQYPHPQQQPYQNPQQQPQNLVINNCNAIPEKKDV